MITGTMRKPPRDRRIDPYRRTPSGGARAEHREGDSQHDQAEEKEQLLAVDHFA
jgi:hypothetical protein